MPIMTFGELLNRESAKQDKLSARKVEVRGRTVEDNFEREYAPSSGSESDGYVVEVEKDLSADEWEEEDEDGNITVHKGGAPNNDQVMSSVEKDPRFSEAQKRARCRFSRIIKKAQLNATHADNQSVIDMSRCSGIGDPGTKYVWGVDDEDGTHELRIYRDKNGYERKRYVQIKRSAGTNAGAGVANSNAGEGTKAGTLRSGKQRKEETL